MICRNETHLESLVLSEINERNETKLASQTEENWMHKYIRLESNVKIFKKFAYVMVDHEIKIKLPVTL